MTAPLPDPPAMPREAILIIPGLEVLPRNAARDRLALGLRHAAERFHARDEGEPGEARHSLNAALPEGGGVVLDLYEAYWLDLVPRQSEEKPLRRLLSGLDLLRYWFFSPVWRAFRHPAMILNGILSAALLLAWYYGVVVAGFAAMGAESALTCPDLAEPALWLNQPAACMGKLGSSMGGWQVWAAMSAVLALVPVAQLVDISWFTKRYLQNERDAQGMGCRDRIRSRVREALVELLEQPGYRSVTVVAHSFGSIVAMDLLADLRPTRPVRLLTLGSPAELLAYRSHWMREEIRRCLDSPAISQWWDFHSRQDWMAAPVPGHKSRHAAHSIPVEREDSLRQRLMGETHKAYFGERQVVETLFAMPETA